MMMQIPEYQPSWSPDYCVKESLEYREKVKEFLLKEVDFKQMSVEELINLGFTWWDDSYTLLLCLLWLAYTLFLNVDHDHRYGIISSGFIVKDGKIMFNAGSTKSKPIF